MKVLSLVFVAIICLSKVAIAGPFTDEMSKCIVRNTTESDRAGFVRWMYAAMSYHPDVKSMSKITPKMAEDINKQTADLVVELLTVRCKEECKQAVEYEGEKSFEVSFGVLGQVAMQSLMTHPNVGEYLSGLESQLDEEKLKTVFGKTKEENDDPKQ